MKPAIRHYERASGAKALRALAAAVLLVASAVTWPQEPAKPAAEPAPAAAEEQKPDSSPPAEQAPAPAATPTPAGTTTESADKAAEESAEAPERFIPKEKSSADNSATFPIDI